MLFIPIHWWHYVESPGLSIAITHTYSVKCNLWHFPNPGFVSLALALQQGIRQAVYGDQRRPASTC